MNIFIDTEDMEERYGEDLYKEYLEKEIYELQQKINRIIEIIELNQYSYGYQIKEEIIKESDVK